jgi:hypothetical protein
MNPEKLKGDAIGKKFDLMVVLPNGEEKRYNNARLVQEDSLGKTFVVDQLEAFGSNRYPGQKCFVAVYPQNIALMCASPCEKENG